MDFVQHAAQCEVLIVFALIKNLIGLIQAFGLDRPTRRGIIAHRVEPYNPESTLCPLSVADSAGRCNTLAESFSRCFEVQRLSRLAAAIRQQLITNKAGLKFFVFLW
jgi:hypothetical protein